MPRSAERRYAWLVLVAGALTMLTRLAGDLHLDGVLYAQVARGLVERGNWLDLTIGGDPYWRKPPLVFWLMGVSYQLGGVSEVTARLPAALGGMLSGVAVYALATRLWDARVGLLAGVILVTTPPFIQNATTARLDTVPTLLSLLSLLAYVRAADSHRTADFALAGACWGLAVLAKGVFGLTGPFFFVLYCATTGRLRTLVSTDFVVSVAVGSAVALPWHVYQVARGGRAFLDVYLFEQTLDRLTGQLAGPDGTRSYLGHLVRDDWPWLPFTVAGMVLAGLAARRGESRAAFLLAWTLGYLALVSLSVGQRGRYLTQLYPPASILAALAVLYPLPERWRARVPAAIAGLCVAGALAVAVLPSRRSYDADEVRALGPVLDRLVPGAREVEGYRLRDLPLRASFLFYLDRDVRNVRRPEDATDGVIVTDVARREELASAGFVVAYANGRFAVMRRESGKR
jgi:4-amino-4-deoxy-L-arabinose transferase-like glycosyltransferase